MQLQEIVKSFQDNEMSYDDMLETCLRLKIHYESSNNTEVVEALKGLYIFIINKKNEGRSIYPIKKEILKFLLLIIKKYT